MNRKRPSAEALQAACDAFNFACAEGGRVAVKLDGKDAPFITTTRSPAQVLSGHSAVVWLNDVSGCYLIDRVTPIPAVEQATPAAERSERASWNTKQWYEHVGAWETPEGHISFGSVMALRAMLIQFGRAHATAPAAAPAGGWIVRERRSTAGHLMDCFIEAPAEGDMPYGLEVLGDDYNGYGGIERKLEHCKLIVSLVNAAKAFSVRDALLEEVAKAVVKDLTPGKTADLPIQWVASNAAIMHAAEVVRSFKSKPEAAATAPTLHAAPYVRNAPLLPMDDSAEARGFHAAIRWNFHDPLTDSLTAVLAVVDDPTRPIAVHARETLAALAAAERGNPDAPKGISLAPLTRCAADRDGDCSHAQCPQLRDGEPAKSGRHCPHDTDQDAE